MPKDYLLLQRKAKNENPYKHYFIDTKGEKLSDEALEILSKYTERFRKIGINFYIKESLNIKDVVE